MPIRFRSRLPLAAMLLTQCTAAGLVAAHDIGGEGSPVHVSMRVRSRWDQDPLPGLVRQVAPNLEQPAELAMLLAKDLPVAGEAPVTASAFTPFAAVVKTRWDDHWLYVESNGLPDHRMMVGITAWQQQVPIPQPYTGVNAWQIPLHPEVAKTPLSAKSHFFRGAIAMAVNGVPIFNPIKNDGKTDTFIAGELDEFGGHCGRGDDYHYHIAPLHLQKVTGIDKPIAYALDGYPIYGLTEPDGSLAGKLDEFNGHTDAQGNYHYHATKTYPYLNGGFHGEVTDRGGQVDPQPRTASIRPALPPLRGAKITGFSMTKPNLYRLEYQVGSEKRSIKYEMLADGKWKFEFIDGQGHANVETYARGGGGGDGGGNRRGPEADGAGGAGPGPGPDGGDDPNRPRRPGPRRDAAGENDDRPPRPDNGDRPPRPDNADRPPRGDNADRPPRGENGDRPPRGDNGDRPPRDANRGGDGANGRPPRNDGPPATPPVMITPIHTGKFSLTSSVVADGGPLPLDFTGDGKGSSLPLEWKGAPAETKTYALVMDHSAPDGMKCYWTMWDIPASVTSLPKDVKGVGKLGSTWKRGETYITPHSQGPGKKVYTLHVYALSAAPKLDQPQAEVTRDVLLTAIKDLVIDSAELKVTYSRPSGEGAGNDDPKKPAERKPRE